MTLKELRAMVDAEPRDRDDQQIVVWLPGSRIRLEPRFLHRDDGLMIEGNITEGSALR